METRVGNTSCQRPPGSKQLSRGQETSFEMLGPPTRAQLLKYQRLAFPHFSFPEFYKNAKTIGWYLRTEGEGYCRLSTDLEISVPWHKSTWCYFQLYERICLWTRHGPNGDVRGHIFHPLLFFHICPWICLSVVQCCKLALSRVSGPFPWRRAFGMWQTVSWKYSRASNFAGTVLEPTENAIFYLPSYISVLPATSKFVHYLEEKNLKTCLT